jgi:prefoldin alpha subunit
MASQKEQQELMFKLAMYEQQMKQLQEQFQAVDHAIGETSSLNSGLNELKEGKDKEIFALIGKGIFAKAKITSNDLIVDVGAKNFVKKNVADTQKIIKEQINKLEQVKKELESKLEELNHEAVKMITKAQKGE